MKLFLLLGMLVSFVGYGEGLDSQSDLAEIKSQCEEWAAMESNDPADKDEYIEQCLINMGYDEQETESYDYVEQSSDDENYYNQ